MENFITIVIFLIFCILIIGIPIGLILWGVKVVLGPVKFKYKTYFLNGYVNHNDITTVKRGECLLKFEKGKFYIIQNDNTIEDNSSDIYNFRIWTYKKGLYLAIKMKTHSEYKFSLINPDSCNSELVYSVPILLFEKLAERLKIPFENCGESTDE